MSLLDTFASWHRQPDDPVRESAVEWLMSRAASYDLDADHAGSGSEPSSARDHDARNLRRAIQRGMATELRDCARDLGDGSLTVQR